MIALVIVLILVIIWIAYNNTALEVNEIVVKNESIPEAFSGYRIAHISDFHNTELGGGNKKLLDMLAQADADIIVITGDLIDSRRTKINIALDFAKAATKIAPTYYANGNHESRIAEYTDLKAGLSEIGVTVLENASVDIALGDDVVTLIGIKDPSFPDGIADSAELKSVLPDNKNYKILLAHRPEYFNVYAGNVDLVFCGHAHGGQFRLPFIGGIIAPVQGLFPEYDAGIYTKENTNMIVSRGIGNSIIPFRINNRPEIVVAELKRL